MLDADVGEHLEVLPDLPKGRPKEISIVLFGGVGMGQMKVPVMILIGRPKLRR